MSIREKHFAALQQSSFSNALHGTSVTVECIGMTRSAALGILFCLAVSFHFRAQSQEGSLSIEGFIIDSAARPTAN